MFVGTSFKNQVIAIFIRRKKREKPQSSGEYQAVKLSDWIYPEEKLIKQNDLRSESNLLYDLFNVILTVPVSVLYQ